MPKPSAGTKDLQSRNITLPRELDDFVGLLIAERGYANYSEVIRDAVRLLKDKEEERKQRFDIARQRAISSLQAHIDGRNPLTDKEQFIRELFDRL